MIKYLCLFWFMALTMKNVLAQIPPTIPSGHEYESNLRFNVQYLAWSNMLELTYRDEVDSRRLQSVRLGTYYRFVDWLKVGAFVQHQYGERHEEDWLARPRWHWRNSKGRGEFLYSLDVTGRTLFGVEDNPLMGEFKIRYNYNFYNQHQFFKLRPGLSYLTSLDGEPLALLYTHYEAYLPVNYSQKLIYEWWWYLGAMFHVSERFMAGPSVARREIVWTQSPDFKERRPQERYANRAKSWVWAMNFLFTQNF